MSNDNKKKSKIGTQLYGAPYLKELAKQNNEINHHWNSPFLLYSLESQVWYEVNVFLHEVGVPERKGDQFFG